MGPFASDDVTGPSPWTSNDLDEPGDRFSFVIVSDRTGGAQPGVFQRGLAITDLLAPSFAIQVGDLIEGYVTDPEALNVQWQEIDQMLSELRTPLFLVPGNHDVSNQLQKERWLDRYGRLHYHFRYADCLFLVVDTQDPPEIVLEGAEGHLDALNYLLRLDPAAIRPRLAQALDWDGTQVAQVSDEQSAYHERVLAEHADVRRTFVFMHMPLWQGEHPAWSRLRSALGDRPYSAFAGHVHNYKATAEGQNHHVRLGPTGGLWVLEGPQGNFHHVTQVTVTQNGPVVANVTLDGVRGFDGRPVRSVALSDTGVM
jgi:hypothetical protein